MRRKTSDYKSEFEIIINKCCQKDKFDIQKHPNGVCSQYEVDQMWKAYYLALEKYGEKERDSGDYFLKHYLDVASIAVDDIG